MTLRNALIEPDRLPRATPLRLTPVAPAFARYRTLAAGLRWLALGVAISVALPDPGRVEPLLSFWALALSLLALLHLAYVWREGRSRAWGLREHDLLYARGLLFRRLTVLPCNRIAHIETSTGPLERRFHLLRITCFTAGGLSADLVIQGLAEADGEAVRSYLLRRIHELDEIQDAFELPAAKEPG